MFFSSHNLSLKDFIPIFNGSTRIGIYVYPRHHLAPLTWSTSILLQVISSDTLPFLTTLINSSLGSPPPHTPDSKWLDSRLKLESSRSLRKNTLDTRWHPAETAGRRRWSLIFHFIWNPLQRAILLTTRPPIAHKTTCETPVRCGSVRLPDGRPPPWRTPGSYIVVWVSGCQEAALEATHSRSVSYGHMTSGISCLRCYTNTNTYHTNSATHCTDNVSLLLSYCIFKLHLFYCLLIFYLFLDIPVIIIIFYFLHFFEFRCFYSV